MRQRETDQLSPAAEIPRQLADGSEERLAGRARHPVPRGAKALAYRGWELLER
jgi:hypothetical protein